MVGKCGEELEVGHKIWAQVYLCPAVATFSNHPPTGRFNLAFPLFLWLDGLQKLLLRSLFPFFPRWIFVQMLPLMSIKFEQTTRAK